jgi:hypothetical protein
MDTKAYIGASIAVVVLGMMISFARIYSKRRDKELKTAQRQFPPTSQQIEDAQALNRLRARENIEAFGGTTQAYIAVPQRVEKLRQPPRAKAPIQLYVPQSGLIELAGKREPAELEGVRGPIEMDSQRRLPDGDVNIPSQPLQP